MMLGEMLEVADAETVAQQRLFHAPASGAWDVPDEVEAKIHRIHPYPAKFPAFITTKALSFAREAGLDVRRVADVFCGCGTVAQEASQLGLEFWGCDINPVATLIASVKGSRHDPAEVRHGLMRVLELLPAALDTRPFSPAAVERLSYWYNADQLSDLIRLLNAIEEVAPEGEKLRPVLHCAFSAILKSTSQWRQRSTKPAFDEHKRPGNVKRAFQRQCEFMASAWEELVRSSDATPQIRCESVLTTAGPEEAVDLIITSPPYVTSYEYADLHQLSALWLGYADDYRSLRKGSVGSSHHKRDFRQEFSRLNRIGFQTVFSLYNHDEPAARAVANYFLDMQMVARRCVEFLRPGGMAVFVIGDTEYRGVPIDNAAHLAESLFDAGFETVKAARRRISNKRHTPFRKGDGRFSGREDIKKTYAEELILIGRRK
ncbi:hypothetical protein [Agrobacterium tumefaciens]|uniref:hypothetical protein n=1 Tax=Agrobacterium tumefaciens TaxID=358 RepID=UPI003B9E1FDD